MEKTRLTSHFPVRYKLLKIICPVDTLEFHSESKRGKPAVNGKASLVFRLEGL